MLTLAYDEAETIEMFGQDMLDDYGVEVPDELAKDLIETYKKLIRLSREINKYAK